MTLSVQQICGDALIYRTDGARLRAEIDKAWPGLEFIEVDFENRQIASASFLDEGIALLALEHPLEELTSRLKVVNITPPDRRLLNSLVRDRANKRLAAAGQTPTS